VKKRTRIPVRRKSDPRVRVVMSAMERALASPFATDDGVALTVAGYFVTLDSPITGWFDDNHDWEPQAFVEIVRAYALNAPSSVLDLMVRIARKQTRWVEWWDEIGWAESRGYAPLLEREP